MIGKMFGGDALPSSRKEYKSTRTVTPESVEAIEIQTPRRRKWNRLIAVSSKDCKKAK
jgi:hypothetical protein